MPRIIARVPADTVTGITRLASAYGTTDSEIIRRLLEPAVSRAVACLPDDLPVPLRLPVAPLPGDIPPADELEPKPAGGRGEVTR